MTSPVQYEPLTASQWVSIARLSFAHSERSVCAVCGKYKSLAQAHHITPLAHQARGDRMSVNHEHEWLCPTHHAAVHVYIGAAVAARERASKPVIDISADLPVEELRKVLEIVERAFT